MHRKCRKWKLCTREPHKEFTELLPTFLSANCESYEPVCHSGWPMPMPMPCSGKEAVKGRVWKIRIKCMYKYNLYWRKMLNYASMPLVKLENSQNNYHNKSVQWCLPNNRNCSAFNVHLITLHEIAAFVSHLTLVCWFN